MPRKIRTIKKSLRKGLGKGKGKGYKNIIPKDPKVHSESARGRKQPQKVAMVRDRTLPNVAIQRDNFGFDVDGKKIELRLGNTTTAGWYWTGDQDDIAGYLIRLESSEVKDEFLQAMKERGVSFNMLQPYLLKSAKKGSGLYQISGDNRIWHFGETGIDEGEEIEQFLESQSEYEDINITDELRNKFSDLIEYPAYKYEDFEADNKKEYTKDMIDIINKSTSFEDFMEQVDNLKDGWLQEIWQWQDEKFSNSLSDAWGKLKKDIGTKEVYSVVEANGKRLALGEFKSYDDAEKFIGRKKGLDVKSVEIIPESFRKEHTMKDKNKFKATGQKELM